MKNISFQNIFNLIFLLCSKCQTSERLHPNHFLNLIAKRNIISILNRILERTDSEAKAENGISKMSETIHCENVSTENFQQIRIDISLRKQRLW
jgi:hypothetical protein